MMMWGQFYFTIYTIAQGLNFPVSSVFLASRKYPYGKEMPQHAFWNLAGRVGRINQDSVGIIGLAAGDDVAAIQRYVSNAIGKLVSRLTQLLDDVEKARRLDKLDLIIQEEQWVDFRCYIAHLWREKKNLDAVLAETEQLLRNTFGFGLLQSKFDEVSRRKVKALLKATKSYAHKLAKHPENATLADATGFSPEGVSSAIMGLNQLE
ncbi:hypothetical protein M1N64_03190 [Peptococcaceae bacterium]|nr:hypothetical protein [Peptococcaceae bacterium]